MRYTYGAIYGLLNGRRRKQFWLLLVAMFLSSLLNLFGVALILPFLSLLSAPDLLETSERLAVVARVLGTEDHLVVLNLLGMGVFVFIVMALLTQAGTIFWTEKFSRNLAHSLATRRLEIYLAQPYEWFLTQHSAELSKSLLDEVNQVVQSSIQPALRVVANGFIFVTLIGLLLAIEPLGALVMAGALGSAFLAVFFSVSTRLRNMGIARKAANRERFQVANEVLQGIKEVKIMGLETTYMARFFRPSKKIAHVQARVAVIGELPRIGVEALTFGGMMLFTLFLLQTRGAGVGDIVPVLGAFAVAGIRLMPTAQILFRDVSKMRFGEAALRSLEDDLRHETAPRPFFVPTGTPDVPPLPFRRAIRLEDVTYSYPEAHRPSIENMSLTIPAGAAVGLVGSTGAGKTTVTDLLLGLVRPQTGRVTVDGQTLDATNMKAWQLNIGYVPQTIRLVDDSIAGNIARGAPGQPLDLAAVERAARLAKLHDFVTTLPDGYDTNVGDAGVKLSGGQLQRVGIARALMRDPSVVVFDEATSALDPLTEKAVLDSLRDLHGSKTLILISHRLKTLGFCDTIFVLDHGRLVDSGDFASLEARRSSFNTMLEALN
jgi:ABC-type multidrug transport system fused ATPase/permease subunit